MVKRRQFITVLIGALGICAISRADMMPVPSLDTADSRRSSRADSLTDLRRARLSISEADFPGIADISSSLVGFLPELNPEAGQTSGTKSAPIQADRQNSLSLCLYALLGLGLCRTVPLVKKFRLGCIPDWYHGGGPSQIGHSFAISPDCLPATLVCCFVQPDSTTATQDPLRQRCLELVVSLWRQSQFTPSVLASRGPPPR